MNLNIRSVFRHPQYKMKYFGQITSEIYFNWLKLLISVMQWNIITEIVEIHI